MLIDSEASLLPFFAYQHISTLLISSRISFYLSLRPSRFIIPLSSFLAPHIMLHLSCILRVYISHYRAAVLPWNRMWNWNWNWIGWNVEKHV